MSRHQGYLSPWPAKAKGSAPYGCKWPVWCEIGYVAFQEMEGPPWPGALGILGQV